ncbi:MAG: serine/threonine protein kinase [Planctomycetes bacterium]|nr:serine/threonine protein kinase [Planctomycetota bacterium]
MADERHGASALTTARWTQIRRLFDEVLDVAPAQRDAWLAAACGADDDLRQHLQQLLATDAAVEARLASDARQLALGELVGVTIDGFRIERLLGRGGMGTVYEAEQQRPRRRVALKLLSVQSLDHRARRRFTDEAEFLARLQHPGIAQVLASGSCRHGELELPWIAMELVDHPQPIDRYARAAQLSPRAIVLLLLQVCAAVQFAHQRGIIHRDLKPANVLVDRHGQPKVIDFGIARAAGNTRGLTQPGEWMGTLAYMPPERFAHDADADTTGDVYALGVLAYELLAGRPPFADEGVTPAALIDRVANHDPKPPSRAGARPLPPELDWITLRAMARDRNRRYASVAALADDLERFLRNEAVAAGPPGAGYRLRKFARRHRFALAAAGIAVGAITIGGIVAAFGWHRVAQAEQKLAREARTLREIQTFQERILRGAYGTTRGSDIKLADVVAAAAADVERGSFTDPLVEAGARNSLAVSLLGLGQPLEAIRHLEHARLALSRCGGDIGVGIAIRHNLAVACERAGRLDRAEQESRAALADHLAADGPIATDTAIAQSNLAALLVKRAQCAEALDLATTAMATFERQTPSVPEQIATARTTIAFANAELGRLDDADRAYDDLLAYTAQALPADHPAALAAATSRAVHLHRRGRFAEYRAACEELAATRERLHGENHPDTWAAWNNLAAGQLQCGDPVAAEATFRRVLAGRAAAGIVDGYDNLVTRQNLTVAVRRQGRTAEAVQLAEAVVAAATRELPDPHWLRGVTRKELGACLRELGRFDDAKVELLAAVAMLEQTVGDGDARTQKAIQEVVHLFEAWQQDDEVARWQQRLRR